MDDHPPLPRAARPMSFVALATATSVALVAAWALWPAQAPALHASPATAPLPASATPALAASPPLPAPAPGPGREAPAAAHGTPRGMTAGQWQALQSTLAGHPQREAEIARVVGYMAFADDVRRLQAAPPGPDAEALARGVDAALPLHLARREVSAAEAMRIRQLVLQRLEPDAARQREGLERWRQEHLARSPDAAADPREAAFLQQQAAVVAAWQAQPEPQRTAQSLESSLEALRRSHFGPPPKP